MRMPFQSDAVERRKNGHVQPLEELCEALAEGVASGDAAETAGRVRPVWTKVDEEVFARISPEEKQHGKRYRSSGFVGQIRQFRPTEKSTR